MNDKELKQLVESRVHVKNPYSLIRLLAIKLLEERKRFRKDFRKLFMMVVCDCSEHHMCEFHHMKFSDPTRFRKIMRRIGHSSIEKRDA